MRRPQHRPLGLTLILALVALGVVEADEDFDEDGDLDLEDLEDDSEAGPPPNARPEMEPVEDFDLGMPEEDRNKRMSACYIHMMNRVQHRSDNLEAMVKEVMSAHQGEIKQEQALNTIVFSWMMSCYMNIDNSGMKEAILGRAPSAELEQELFSPRRDRPQQVQQASRRQWTLLEKVLTDQQQRQQQQRQQQQQKSAPSPGRSSQSAPSPGGADTGGNLGAGGPLLAGLSGQSQAIYVLVVFAVIFGLSAIGVWRLMRVEQASRERLSKKKAERKGGRKKQ